MDTRAGLVGVPQTIHKYIGTCLQMKDRLDNSKKSLHNHQYHQNLICVQFQP